MRNNVRQCCEQEVEAIYTYLVRRNANAEQQQQVVRGEQNRAQLREDEQKNACRVTTTMKTD